MTSDAAEFEAFAVVEPVFQAEVERLGAGAFDAERLAAESPAVRMLIATRAIDGQVSNGGWPAVFYNEVVPLLPAAIEGYRLLGLDEHARLAERIREHDFDPDAEDDDAWEAFDAE